MFESARIRLTAWYLLIIMSVSILFSFIIYTGINSELQRFEHIHAMVQDHERQGIPVPRQMLRSYVDPEIITASRTRLVTGLGIINVAILVVAGAAGYFLAARTLRPIKQMVDQLNRFITDASHELRTPITSLRSEIEVNLRNKQLTLPQAKNLMQSNLEEVIHLQKLSDTLLELTQYEKANGSSHFVKLKLADVIEEAVKNIQGQAKKKEITIEHDVNGTMIYGNRDRLRELFTILLDNAIKYSDPKSIVRINGKKEGKIVKINVIDEGEGIDKKALPHIFDRFYRADKARSKNVGGFGLGLSIAKKIVMLHNGSLDVTSKIGKGTTFSIRLLLNKTS